MFYITIPSMKPQMLFGAIMSLIATFNAGSIGVQLSGQNPTPQNAGQLIVPISSNTPTTMNTQSRTYRFYTNSSDQTVATGTYSFNISFDGYGVSSVGTI